MRGGDIRSNIWAKWAGTNVELDHNYIVNTGVAENSSAGIALSEAGENWDIHHNTVLGAHHGINVGGRRENENLHIHHNTISNQRIQGQKSPQAIALGSTWDPALLERVASAISDEARGFNVKSGKGLTYWSPVINMLRDPRWGRIEEGYSEDVYLTSALAVAFVKVLQGDDPHYLKVVATPKHFAANNSEFNRETGSSQVDERTLREYYTSAFRACVEAGAFSVMAAYNSIDGAT